MLQKLFEKQKTNKQFHVTFAFSKQTEGYYSEVRKRMNKKFLKDNEQQ
jgi:hypothetical protein